MTRFPWDALGLILSSTGQLASKIIRTVKTPDTSKYRRELVHSSKKDRGKTFFTFRFSTKYGMYKPKCGIDKLLMSWGHDEYLYRVLVHNKTKLPNQALAMIRYHSFYPWHAGGDYMHFCTNEDMEMLKWINDFKQVSIFNHRVSLLSSKMTKTNEKKKKQKTKEIRRKKW